MINCNKVKNKCFQKMLKFKKEISGFIIAEVEIELVLVQRGAKNQSSRK